MRRRENTVRWVLTLASLGIFVGAWQWYGSDPAHLATPPPSQVFPALGRALWHRGLLGDTAGTLLELVIGIAISLVFGVVVGFAIGLFPWAKETLDPLVDAIYAMPVIMLIPIIGVYTGLGFRGRIFIVFLYVALVIVVNTSTGVREIDGEILSTARAFGYRKLRLVTKIMFPAAVSHIAAGTAVGVSRAVHGAVTAEMLLVTANVGGFIVARQSEFDNAALLAGIAWTVVLGYGLYGLALWVERRATRWRAPARA